MPPMAVGADAYVVKSRLASDLKLAVSEVLANSKFADWPEFGRYPSGHIALQDHSDLVWYRNIRIREL